MMTDTQRFNTTRFQSLPSAEQDRVFDAVLLLLSRPDRIEPFGRTRCRLELRSAVEAMRADPVRDAAQAESLTLFAIRFLRSVTDIPEQDVPAGCRSAADQGA
ncbi:hypothetical protein [Rhizobium sp. SSA_523]|uniref:hypothetical protein n=1 Tax=Rhizobium sp. SSA_523 TaxID=2952477 RepID=UPI00209012CA|nr:hypothetical protein [Rhizobium sp. SSA_523]MCO5733949.1 hypothetical protein [Rhizobium sp. SSA_523]WKC24791.1 hypothetical protein QTJ18_12265 [Rhizobium sp. SSA_523]